MRRHVLVTRSDLVVFLLDVRDGLLPVVVLVDAAIVVGVGVASSSCRYIHCRDVGARSCLYRYYCLRAVTLRSLLGSQDREVKDKLLHSRSAC